MRSSVSLLHRGAWYVFAILAYSAAAHSADASGKYAPRGAGFARCEHFLRAHETKDKEWFVFFGWMDGYISALNEKSPDTFDVAPWQSTELLAEVIRQTCAKDPTQSFFAAARGTIEALNDYRLTTAQEHIVLQLDDESMLVYPDTLRRAQTSLTRLGHYSGTIDGTYGTDTQAALKAFQTANDIPVTGLPGPITLWALLVENRP